MKKLWVREVVKGSYIDVWDFDDKIDKVIPRLMNLKKSAEEKGYKNAEIEVDVYCDEVHIKLVGERLETDVELKKRVEAIKENKEKVKKAKEEVEKEERKLYEKLKKKYG